MATTRNTLARLAATPPKKSPPPQTPAAPRLRPASTTVPAFISLKINGDPKAFTTETTENTEENRTKAHHRDTERDGESADLFTTEDTENTEEKQDLSV
jgi:hypothetical protein